MVSKRTAQGKVAYLEKKKNRYLVTVSRGLVYRSLSLVQIALTPRKKETYSKPSALSPRKVEDIRRAAPLERRTEKGD